MLPDVNVFDVSDEAGRVVAATATEESAKALADAVTHRLRLLCTEEDGGRDVLARERRKKGRKTHPKA
jgi:hypothetical protein